MHTSGLSSFGCRGARRTRIERRLNHLFDIRVIHARDADEYNAFGLHDVAARNDEQVYLRVVIPHVGLCEGVEDALAIVVEISAALVGRAHKHHNGKALSPRRHRAEDLLDLFPILSASIRDYEMVSELSVVLIE